MTVILHGDDQTQSRQKLVELKSESQPAEVLVIADRDISWGKIEQVSQSGLLFSQERLLVLENFFSQSHWQKLAPLLNDVSVIFWENKKLLPVTLKAATAAFPRATILEFKTPAVIFQFLDALRPNNHQLPIILGKILADEPAEQVLALLARRVGLLLLAKMKVLDQEKKMASWQIAKLTHQADLFTQDQLKTLHHQLLDSDYKNKTGQSPLTLGESLELALFNL